ncbi:MAG TPA: cytochrome C oxidase subunit IV family protein [Thermoanaerobaculia bacterium]|nr:cytochrome C oxidase subunit IV family protein [Thermoanaerobaculia bacterium]
MQTHQHDEQQAHAPAHHVASLAMYFGVFIALMVLTMATVAVSRIDLGALNTPLALVIAIVKAVLVILFFMHVIQSSRLTWVVVVSAFAWLAVMFLLTFADYLTRGWPV